MRFGSTKQSRRWLPRRTKSRSDHAHGEQVGQTGSDDGSLEEACEIDTDDFNTPRSTRSGTIIMEGASTLSFLRHTVRKWTKSKEFDFVIGCVIVLNSVTLGLDLTFRLEEEQGGTHRALSGWTQDFVQPVETCCLVIYIIELSMRFFGSGLKCLEDTWVKFDCVLVTLGMMSEWIFVALDGDTNLGPLMVLRLMRLARLARTVRLLVRFRTLWFLVGGLMSSAGTMFYTVLILFTIVYFFGAIGVELVTLNPLSRTDDDFAQIVDDYFRTVPETMLTLLQFTCLDSIGMIYRPLIMKDPVLLFYFLGVILCVPVVLMNLVTAVLVNSAIERAKQNQEAEQMYKDKQKKRLVKKLQVVFERLDEDKSGEVSITEISQISDEDKKLLFDLIAVSDPVEIFDALNVDGDDFISIDEFCNGVWQLMTTQSPLEIQRMEKQTGIIFDRVKAVETTQLSMERSLLQLGRTQLDMKQTLDRLCDVLMPVEAKAARLQDAAIAKQRDQLPEVDGKVSVLSQPVMATTDEVNSAPATEAAFPSAEGLKDRHSPPDSTPPSNESFFDLPDDAGPPPPPSARPQLLATSSESTSDLHDKL